MGNLSNKTAVITGATRGFGLAVAREFLREGCQVVLSSRNQQNIDQALEELHAGNQADGIRCDVSNLNQVTDLAQFTCQRYGSFDIWINNAGISGPYGPTAYTSPTTFHSVIQTNVMGVYHGSYVALKHFLSKKAGKIINLVGHGYKGPVPYQNAYASSKAWVYSFTTALAKENEGNGVGIFSFQPGMMLTDLLLHIDVIQGYEEKLKAFPFIIQALSKPIEIPAKKVAWLASSATDGMPGKLVSTQSGIGVLLGFLKAGLRTVLKKAGSQETLDIKIKTIEKS